MILLRGKIDEITPFLASVFGLLVMLVNVSNCLSVSIVSDVSIVRSS